MKKYILSIASLLAALSLNSCFQKETTIHLKKDGSGTISEDVRLSKQMLAMPADDLKMMLAEAEKAAMLQAARLGEGVTFVKFEKISQGDSKGWRSSYEFADINKVRISNRIDMESADTEPAEINAKHLIAFKYSDGNLTIHPNMDTDAEKPAAAAEGGQEPPAEAVAQMKEMLGELKYGIKLTVDSGIAETNATHRADNTITLLELDMGKVMADQENMKRLGGVDEGDPSGSLQALKGADGVRFETKPEVTVKLK
jgi:hypothetical protein